VQNPRSSYTLQALKRSSGISPRSWRAHHGAADFKQAVDLASRFNGSDEAVRAYLDWLAIVTRDEHEGFQCRVLSAGDARQAPGSGWHDVF
jgi:hypothetical protein